MGIANHSLSKIILSPNPVYNSFSLILEDKNQIVQKITLLNVHGQVIKGINSPNNKIDVSELSNGIFYVKLITENKTFYKKMVKK